MTGRNHKPVPGLDKEKEFEKGNSTWVETVITWIFMFLCAGFLVLMISGCGQEFAEAHYTVNKVESTEPVTHNMIGVNALVDLPIGEGLYYDYTTGIVYWWGGYMTNNYCSSTPTPYYSPNGLLYRYIPETNTIEEIVPVNAD